MLNHFHQKYHAKDFGVKLLQNVDSVDQGCFRAWLILPCQIQSINLKMDKNEDKAVLPRKADAFLLEMIKRMNGFKDAAWKQMDKIETIELVLEDFGHMTVMNRFKGLKSLTLINCGIAHIEGLNDCSRLQSLWLNENEITKIEGLQKCSSLKAIYISHNSIRNIQDLNGLSTLQTLWLCDNKIQVLQNLSSLSQLKQLWVAGNQIECIKTSLDDLVSLVDLNISGNKICAFKEVLNLNRLPNLKILSFYDPHFGQNPICNLCNYSTYVLYHLRNITKLDTLATNEELKAYAESTLMRKKMYYNMRIKTIERTFSTLTKLAEKAKRIKLDIINEDLANLFLKINDIGQDIKQINELKEIYSLKKEELSHIDTVFESVNKKLREVNKESIRKQLAQFQTGGNIRLVEGKPSERWYVSCIDLIRSRFQPESLTQFDIENIHIKRVVRIHNTFLKNKFEEKMEMLTDLASLNSRKQLEYLFYGVDPNFPSQLEHVIQEGFRAPQEARKLGICPFVPLFNSILCADLPRIMHHLQSQKANNRMDKNFIKKRNLSQVCLLPTGSILICKVLIIREEVDTNCPFFDPAIPSSQLFRKGKVDFQEGHYAVKRSLENQSKEKMWFVMDNNIVIPEYLVQYDYVLRNPAQNKVADFTDSVALLQTNDDEFISAKNIGTFQKEINSIYNALIQEVSSYRFESIDEKNNPNLEMPAVELDNLQVGSVKVMLINYFKYSLSRSNLYYELNENMLFQGKEDFQIKKLNIQDSSVLEFANLSNLKIKSLSFIPPFKQLQVLILSYNALTALTELEELSNIKKLDASHNKISALSGVCSLPLEHLDLSHNSFTSVQSLGIIQLCRGTLKEVNFLFNAFEEEKQAVVFLASKLPNLVWLNHLPKNRFTMFESEENAAVMITDELLRQNCQIMQSKSLDSSDWKLSIESLSITHMKLSSMEGLQWLVNLRHINLANNLLKQIICIDSCKLLEQLNLERNQIACIQNLEGLIYLKKIQLGKNRISKIEGISTLNNLLQLSLQDNSIVSLAEFPELRSLVQLYIGNNKINDSNQIKALTCLNKLIILDLSGNPISKEESYRFYTLYLLKKKLKVLDGISVQTPEHLQAEEHFTGRLTDQILLANLKGDSCDKILALELKSCNLKDFEDMFNFRKFPVLSELDLSNNQFSSVRMLGILPSLKILILQANKIETLHYNAEISVQKGLNGCQNLQILDLSNNLLKDFHGLHLCRLAQLKILKAEQNEITKIDCLENLKQIKELNVNENKVRQLDPNSFEGKLPMKCLKIDNNGLKNFQNIQKLLRLHHLFANGNKITEFYDIEKLAELPYIKQLELTGNILYRKPGYRVTLIRKLPGLRFLDGKEITEAERTEPNIMNQQPPPPPPNMPQLYAVQSANQRQVPVRLSSVNFEGVFTSSRLNMETLISQNLYNNANNTNANSGNPPNQLNPNASRPNR